MSRVTIAGSTVEALRASLQSDVADRLAALGETPEVLGVGADVQEVGPVEQALTTHPERYLRHLFTDRERTDLGWPAASAAAMAPAAACRFAAKEAVVKALEPAGRTWSWHEITVDETRHGELFLTGSAHQLSTRRGIVRWVLSCVSDANHAVALAVGVRPATNTPADQTAELGGR